MNLVAADILTELQSRSLLPSTHAAVLVGGSVARGWQHRNSDVDIFVVTDQRWSTETCGHTQVALTPATVPTETVHIGGQRWEIRYWLDSQVDQMITKSSWPAFNAGGGAAFASAESVFLERIGHALDVSGTEWLDRRRRDIAESAFTAIVVTMALNRSDSMIEDAAGLLASGDSETAVLCAHRGFGHAVDALLASCGELGQEAKWRARRMRLAHQDVITFDEYWTAETMLDLPDVAPEVWVERLIRLCQRISTEVSIGGR